MVHALHEAQRVLRPNGILFDLRPAPVHRQIAIQTETRYQEIGVMREDFEDDHFANRAVKQVLREGLFKSEKHVEFNCNRVMDSFKEFNAWILDFTNRNRVPAQDRLLREVKEAYHATPGKKKIVIHAPLMLRLMRSLAG
jgi:hypothetical protein